MRFLLPTLCLTLLTAIGRTAQGTEDLALVRGAEQVETIVGKLMAERRIPGLSVSIAIDKQLVYEKAFGQADLEHAVPATFETRFRTASVAKPMTAAVILSLADEGKIDLDADIRTCCADFPEKQWKVTTRQLLGHLGGVRHYKSSAEASSTEHFFSLQSALATFKDDPLLHEPGSKFLYSSFGYNLLGSIAEGAGGKPFPQLLQERVLDSAGMSLTVIDDQSAIIPGRSRGYIRADARLSEPFRPDTISPRARSTIPRCTTRA